ncbi:MAG: hsp70 nucleotide exchange factor fes1 [Chaenotheca gracillima]|nr:MAG: hsp70 nucleotide exchange factor fes1 [Chaenotheca gracillima]
MPPLANKAPSLLRACARTRLPAVSQSVTALQQRRGKASDEVHTSFESPFKNIEKNPTTNIPDFSRYRSKRSSESNLVFQYFVVGTTGLLAAAGAKATVQDFLVNMSASADVLAMAKVEVDLAAIPLGKNVVIKWRGKPVFIRHRTPDEIKEAEAVKVETLRDPQTDAERVKKPEWLIMLGSSPSFDLLQLLSCALQNQRVA